MVCSILGSCSTCQNICKVYIIRKENPTKHIKIIDHAIQLHILEIHRFLFLKPYPLQINLPKLGSKNRQLHAPPPPPIFFHQLCHLRCSSTQKYRMAVSNRGGPPKSSIKKWVALQKYRGGPPKSSIFIGISMK